MRSTLPTGVEGGNASESRNAYQWLIGPFIPESTSDVRHTSDIELKWSEHAAGDARTEWSSDETATTMTLLISGSYDTEFEDGSVFEHRSLGDYVIWKPGVNHKWTVHEDSLILTIRWPSSWTPETSAHPIDA
ncbi:MAG: signal peptidase I [Candidatus Doudnabacteria bacterium]|nr:signal peptidase I [Candidatus Doudnabacteria bacterium]MCA9387831.1 signal peptidase I [Candidatus Andersenbacteria bacterium]